MDSNTPQLPPSETESRSMDSTPPQQLRPSETENRSMDTTIQLPPNFFNLQEVKSSKLPLGLKLTKTAEFLTKYWSWRFERATGKPLAVAVGDPQWNKASTIPATSISIGPNWRKESIREDDLTLKLYFLKKKLIWEFLNPISKEKEKIEVSWSDITAIDAYIPDHQPGILRIKLGNKPLFYRETTPFAGKHTIWEATHDFTHGQAASRHGIHEARFAPGVLDAHYPKLLLSDPRLLELSKNNATVPPYPYYSTHQLGESSTTAPSQSQSQSHPIPFPVGVGESSLHMQMQIQGESSRYAKHQTPGLLMHMPSQQLPFSFTGVEQSLPFFNMQGESSRNANQYQTPLSMPSMSSQQLPFSLTGVEQSLLYNNPTPSMAAASQYLNPAIRVVSSPGIFSEMSFHMEGESSSSSSRNADHHQTVPMLSGDHSTATAALESNIYGGEQWQELGSNYYFGTGVTADPEQPLPVLDGDGNTGNDSMVPNINRRPT